MNKFLSIKQALLSLVFALICFTSFANKELFIQARNSQREGNYDEAIKIYKSLLTQTTSLSSLSDQQLFIYTEGLMQLMNAYQSNGEPEACITALNEIFEASPILQDECLRDYYSVLGYALSRTERMEEAEQTMLKAIALPLHRATPERYFRDYAYAAAVFYNNPNYHKEVISWCQEALRQAELTSNTSGAQYVQTMLGSLYKRYGLLNEALEMLQKSKETAEQNGDDLGMLVSLNALADIFIYYDIPEYANLYATDAVRVAQNTTENNPMITAQTYINKGRVLHSMGDIDSATFYNEKAHTLCQSLPYNSGMADVNILGGRILTARGGNLSALRLKS